MSTPETGVQEWRDIPWPELEKNVHRLQRGGSIELPSGEKRGKSSPTATVTDEFLVGQMSGAARRVTQDNRGKNTPGIDGVAALGPEERN